MDLNPNGTEAPFAKPDLNPKCVRHWLKRQPYLHLLFPSASYCSSESSSSSTNSCSMLHWGRHYHYHSELARLWSTESQNYCHSSNPMASLGFGTVAAMLSETKGLFIARRRMMTTDAFRRLFVRFSCNVTSFLASSQSVRSAAVSCFPFQRTCLCLMALWKELLSCRNARKKPDATRFAIKNKKSEKARLAFSQGNERWR
jgi:hypothetical protein